VCDACANAAEARRAEKTRFGEKRLGARAAREERAVDDERGWTI
jgi:hypothetical protein